MIMNNIDLTPKSKKSRPVYCYYIIRGMNSKTNKMSSTIIIAPRNTGQEIIATTAGYVRPYEVSLDQQRMLPTERQITYAKSLGIKIPKDATFEDLSTFISQKNGEDSPDLAPLGLLEFAAENKICISAYAGTRLAIMKLLTQITNKNLISFFCYFVYCYTNAVEIGNYNSTKYADIFDKFAAYHTDDGTLEMIQAFSYEDIKAFMSRPITRGLSIEKALFIEGINDYLSKHI
jgi:hypothetical protein